MNKSCLKNTHLSYFENTLWLGLRWIVVEYPGGLQGCEAGSEEISPPGVDPSNPWGVPGADRTPKLPKLLDDLEKVNCMNNINK